MKVVEIALSGFLPSTLFNVIINNNKMALGSNFGSSRRFLYGSFGDFKVFWLIKLPIGNFPLLK